MIINYIMFQSSQKNQISKEDDTFSFIDFFINDEISNPRDTHDPFELPITYIKKEYLHSLSSVVINDLEYKSIINHVLSETADDDPSFGNLTKKKWCKYITTDVQFLHDTQDILKTIDITDTDTDTNPNTNSIQNYNQFFTIWDDVNNDYFLGKYCYITWPKLSHLNKSVSCLQLLFTVNILSPLISLTFPILILIIPFFLLKLRGIPINVEFYLKVVKELFQNYFFGKMKSNDLSFGKMFYLIFTSMVYIFQVYQNINTCSIYYQNIKTINKNLLFMIEYLSNTINKMNNFVKQYQNKLSYQTFCQDVQKHSTNLNELLNELSFITEFQYTPKKFTEIGCMLRCYHELRNNITIYTSIKYSIGFKGYLENMISISKKLHNNTLSCATIDEKSPTSIKNQFYPLTQTDNIVTNNINMKNNIIITGPNASGKTTLIKSTAINIILSQQFGCGFYSSCSLSPYHHIHSYINIPDTSGRDSLFQAESRQCKNILDIINSSSPNHHHFCIFDELYSGTNPNEAKKAGLAFLTYISKYSNIDFILTTHYIGMCKKIKKQNKLNELDIKKIVNYKMDVIEKDNIIEYTYKMVNGISQVQGALHVFKEMNYPKEILQSF